MEFREEPISPALASRDERALFTIPVLVLRFVPASRDGGFLDPYKAPNYFDLNPPIPLHDKLAELDRELPQTRFFFEEGTKYRAYRNPAAPPSITYPIVGIYTIDDLPPASKQFFAPDRNGKPVPFPDWFRVLKEIDARTWVEERGVRQIWVWSTHYMGDEPSFDAKLVSQANLRSLTESNMAGPYGNISNSWRYKDLPEYRHTYTLYQFNMLRSVNENVHNHIHQIEALLNHVEGRDTTPHSAWSKLLFWGRFVGADATGRLTSPRRCGWCHYPPNASKDYSYKEMETVLSDLEDWTPDGSGQFAPINANRWQRIEAQWHLLWMQSLPGRDNGLKDGRHALTNWWRFIGDWDEVKRAGARLTE